MWCRFVSSSLPSFVVTVVFAVCGNCRDCISWKEAIKETNRMIECVATFVNHLIISLVHASNVSMCSSHYRDANEHTKVNWKGVGGHMRTHNTMISVECRWSVDTLPKLINKMCHYLNKKRLHFQCAKDCEGRQTNMPINLDLTEDCVRVHMNLYMWLHAI